MFPKTVVTRGQTYFFEKLVSAKAARLALVLGSLMLMSIAVNALIILVDSSGFDPVRGDRSLSCLGATEP